jgi:hypothetical protein
VNKHFVSAGNGEGAMEQVSYFIAGAMFAVSLLKVVVRIIGRKAKK